jgi:uncharacterized membrane-anchored protein YhcB (DUF1043 family)
MTCWVAVVVAAWVGVFVGFLLAAMAFISKENQR